MQSEDLVRMGHMLDYAREAVTFAAGKSRSDLDEDRMLVFALMKAIEVVGEAAANVTQDYRDHYPDIPWRKIVGMRNRLIHAYVEVDLDILWETVVRALPPLIQSLEKFLGSH
jgi:uncharacterized protein with HEPN domain